jgi:hypothetical protein
MVSKKAVTRYILCVAAAFLAGCPTGHPSAQADAMDVCEPSLTAEPSHRQVPAVIGDHLFREMIGWIAMNTSYDLVVTYGDPPTVSFCTVGEIITYEQSELLVDPILLAAFDREKRHIFLTHPWSPLNYFDQSVLLHELIHDVQLQNRDWDCTGAPELEAYRLQDKWLFEHNIMHRFDWAMITRLSRCPDDSEAR